MSKPEIDNLITINKVDGAILMYSMKVTMATQIQIDFLQRSLIIETCKFSIKQMIDS